MLTKKYSEYLTISKFLSSLRQINRIQGGKEDLLNDGYGAVICYFYAYKHTVSHRRFVSHNISVYESERETKSQLNWLGKSDIRQVS